MITAVFTPGFDHADVSGLWQYDYGQKLRIQGLSLPPAVEIQFSLNKSGGNSESRVGVTKNGVTDVPIPDSMLENGGSVQNYYIYAFIYITDETSGKTVKWVQLHVNSRPKPEAFDSPEEKELFREAIAAVNESAGRAETAQRAVEEAKEQVAKDKEEVLIAKTAVEKLEKNVTENKEFVRQTVENFTSLAENAVDNVNVAGQNQVNNIEKAGQAALDNISNGVDDGLTQSGKAADAKETGERIDKLKGDLGDRREEFYCVYNHFDKDNVLASTYYKSSGTGSNAGYCAEKIKVRKGVKYYSNNINSIRKEFSFFEKSDGTRTSLDGQNNISVIGSVYLQFNGYEPLEDGYLCLTLGVGTFDNLVVTNNEYVNDFYPYKKLIKAFTLGENIIVGKIEEKDIDFIKVVSNLVNNDDYILNAHYRNYGSVPRITHGADGYSCIKIKVEKGKHYSSLGSFNKNFSYFDINGDENQRYSLTNYDSCVVNGDFANIVDFIPEYDGNLAITINATDPTKKLSIIEYDKQPTIISPYGETYKLIVKDVEYENRTTLRVEKNGTGDFTTIKECLDYVNSNRHIQFTVYVGNGTYDLIEEFGDEYFANLGVESRAGIKVDNNVHLIFSSNSKVVCNYTGDNVNVKKNFSPFNTNTGVKQRGFTLENLNLECSNVRYAIHDETSGQTEPYRNIYKNCFIKLDNSNNSYGYPQCIGGGLGNAGEIIIENCYYESVHSDNSEAIVSYHNNSGNGINRIVVTGCYFANKDTCRCSHLGSGTNVSTMIVSNCSMGAEPFVIYEQEGAYENMRLIKWNNEIRS